MSLNQIQVQSERIENTTIIRFKGAINSLTYNTFLDEVKYANRRGGVILDMEEVEVVSSVGIQALKQTSELSYNSGNKIVLLNLSEHVKDVLNMVGLLKILPIAANEELAMKMVEKA